MKVNSKLIVKVIVAYITTLVLGMVSEFGITGIDMILPCVFACALTVYILVDKYGQRKDAIYGWIMGLIVSAAYVVGNHVTINDKERFVSPFSIFDIAAIIVLTVFFAAVVVLLLSALDIYKKANKQGTLKKKQSKNEIIKYYSITFIIILACYLPYYVGMFPGNIGKDSFESVEMVLGRLPWTNHHPVLFTALIGVIVSPLSKVVNITVAMGVFTFLHMLAFIATLSYMQLWLWLRGTPRWIRVMALMFFALHPFMAMYSIYITKDVLFSCAFVLLVLLLYDIAGPNGNELVRRKCTWVRIALFSILMLLLRNNAILISIGLFVVFLIAYKECHKSILISFGVVFLTFGFFKGPICSWIGIESSSFAEVASVPLQQLGYVVTNNPDSIYEEDMLFLEQLLPSEELAEAYTLGYTDPYKFHPEFDDELINSAKWKFLQIWAHNLPSNLSDYVKAYLAQTFGYWHYGTTNTVCTEGVVDNNLGIEQWGISAIQRIVNKLMLGMRKAPLLCILSSMAAQMTMVLLLALIYIREAICRNGVWYSRRLIAIIPGVLLWVSIMLATPAYCLLRYMFPLFVLWPIMTEEMLEYVIYEDTNNNTCI